MEPVKMFEMGIGFANLIKIWDDYKISTEINCGIRSNLTSGALFDQEIKNYLSKITIGNNN